MKEVERFSLGGYAFTLGEQTLLSLSAARGSPRFIAEAADDLPESLLVPLITFPMLQFGR